MRLGETDLGIKAIEFDAISDQISETHMADRESVGGWVGTDS